MTRLLQTILAYLVPELYLVAPSKLMDWSPELWIVLLFIGFLLVIGVRVYANRSRKEALNAVLARLGPFRLDDRAPFSLEERKGLSLFCRGNSRKWENIFSNNAPVITELLFDFGYTFGIPLLASVRYRQSPHSPQRVTNLPIFKWPRQRLWTG